MNKWSERLLKLIGRWRLPPAPPRVQYPKVVQSEAAPESAMIEPDTMHLVIVNGQPRWAMMRCPCGCQDTITLSLQPVHRPHWQAFLSEHHRISLHPSVWRTQGCHSHFVVDDGRIYWA